MASFNYNVYDYITQYGQDVTSLTPLCTISAYNTQPFSHFMSLIATALNVADDSFEIMFDDLQSNTVSMLTDLSSSFMNFDIGNTPLFYFSTGPQQENYDLTILAEDNTTKCVITNISNLAKVSDLYSRVAQETGATLGTFVIHITTQNNGTYVLNMGSLYENGVTDTSVLRFLPVNDSQAPCFLAHAPVLTPSGYKKIATLREGDLVTTGDGRSVAIQHVSRTRIAAGGPSVNPYSIPKGSFGATSRLLISPNHKVHTGSGAVEAKYLGLKQETMTGPFDYYNLELPNWSTDTMVVAGVTVESLAPIRRITVSALEFAHMIKNQYGSITPELVEKIRAKVKLMPNGTVNVPVMTKK
jgi:hypothetical protein